MQGCEALRMGVRVGSKLAEDARDARVAVVSSGVLTPSGVMLLRTEA